ncbi:DUF4232 domain-containing protein [Jatrophihabitans sp.]|uniref:DUF4232 domain-containing protein n=1 Tax=Jatrophihabitans sp. TaxID=1932789 RepID=UPI002C15C1B0|nr:DUF4232 domain-containing protein [Jatrophihabitans sp.]
MTAILRTRGCLLLAAVLVLATACGQADQQQAAAPAASTPAGSQPVSADPAGSEPASSSPAGIASRPTRTPTTPSPRPAPSTPTGSPVAGPIEAGGCPTAALAIEALRASGAAGHQYAFLQFTNRSAKTCSLTGYPGVQLVRAGAPLGQPATRSGKPARTLQLAPGKSVTAELVVASTCQADKSDSVAIYPPNRTERLVVPLSVRGCPMSIDPVVAG